MKRLDSDEEEVEQLDAKQKELRRKILFYRATFANLW